MKFLTAFILLILLNIAVAAQGWAWKTYSPPNHTWTILAPAPLKPDAEAQTDGSKGSFSYNDFNGFFAVIYRDAPRRFLPWKPDYSGYIEQVRDSVADANRGKIIKDTEFVSRGRIVREVQVKFPSGVTRGAEGQIINKYRVQRFRMFFIGKRFYAILAVLAENEIDKPEVSRFLDSFVINSAPTVVPDTYSTDEDTPLNVGADKGVLINDRDAENDSLIVSASSKPFTPPSHGSLTLNSDGSFNYKPDINFNGTDSFTYKANDGSLDSTTTATVTIIVKPVNDPPTISGIPASITVDELTPLGLIAVGSDVDNPVSSLRYSLNGAPAGAAIDAKTGTFLWTPDEAQGPGTYTFQVNVSDGLAVTGTNITVNVREVNSPPRILNAPASLSINELELWLFNVQATDTDIPKQTLTYSLVDAPAGSAIDSTTGVINWTPTEAQGDNSTYKFTVRVSDGIATTDAILNVKVNEVNVAPKLNPIGSKTIDEETNLNFTVTASDSDLPANTLTYTMTNAPAGAILNPATGVFSWMPTEAQGPGNYAVTFHVTDNGTPSLSAQETINITVNEVNKPPVAGNVSVSLDEDTSVSIMLKGTDPDLPANKLTYSIIKPPEQGIISGSAPNLTYQPDANFNGSDSFTYKINDGSLDSNTATVTINVKPVNDAPTANPDTATTMQDVPVFINVTANDTDIDGDKIILTNVSDAVNGKAEIVGGQAKFTPNPNFHGVGSFKYTISDGNGGTSSSTVTITINPVNPKN